MSKTELEKGEKEAMEGLLASAEENVKQVPNFQLAQKIYEYRLSQSVLVKDKIIEFIRDDSMGKYYEGSRRVYSFTSAYSFAHVCLLMLARSS